MSSENGKTCGKGAMERRQLIELRVLGKFVISKSQIYGLFQFQSSFDNSQFLDELDTAFRDANPHCKPSA